MRFTSPPDLSQEKARSSGEKRSPDTSFRVGKHLLKTKVCSLFLNGNCHYGEERCFYAHSVQELRELPQLERTSLCPSYSKGKCRRGDNCKYAHSVDEMTISARRVLCLWYQEGHCSHGQSCRFSHSELKKLRVSPIKNDGLSGRERRRTESNVSSSVLSPSSGMLRTSHDRNHILHKGVSFDEFDCSASIQSYASTGYSILDLLSSPSESSQVVASPFTSSQTQTCHKCGSSIGCICLVFEECSELLRLL